MDDTMARRVAIAARQRLLASAGALWTFSMVLFVGVLALFWAMIAGTIVGAGADAALMSTSTATGLVALYSGFRVRLDAMLFAMLDLPGTVCAADFAAGIDRFRARLLSGDHADDDLALRLAGAMRWWARRVPLDSPMRILKR